MYSSKNFREYLNSLMNHMVKVTFFTASTRSFLVGKLTHVGEDFIFIENPDQPKTALLIDFIIMIEESN